MYSFCNHFHILWWLPPKFDCGIFFKYYRSHTSLVIWRIIDIIILFFYSYNSLGCGALILHWVLHQENVLLYCRYAIRQITNKLLHPYAKFITSEWLFFLLFYQSLAIYTCMREPCYSTIIDYSCKDDLLQNAL